MLEKTERQPRRDKAIYLSILVCFRIILNNQYYRWWNMLYQPWKYYKSCQIIK